MKLCWFTGYNATLSGYRYETGERAPGEGGSADGYQNVTIFSADSASEAFEVQFHKYNENTLIVTRNVSLPPELLTRVKRDIQLWALASRDCNA